MVFAGSVQAEGKYEHLTDSQRSRLLINIGEDYAYCSAMTSGFAHCINNTEPGAGDEWQSFAVSLIDNGMTFHAMSVLVSDPDADVDLAYQAFGAKVQNHSDEITAKTGNCANYVSLHKNAIQECVAMPKDVVGHTTKWMNELGYPLSP